MNGSTRETIADTIAFVLWGLWWGLMDGLVGGALVAGVAVPLVGAPFGAFIGVFVGVPLGALTGLTLAVFVALERRRGRELDAIADRMPRVVTAVVVTTVVLLAVVAGPNLLGLRGWGAVWTAAVLTGAFAAAVWLGRRSARSTGRWYVARETDRVHRAATATPGSTRRSCARVARAAFCRRPPLAAHRR